MTVYLNGISAAVPPHTLPQEIVLEKALSMLLPLFPHLQHLSSVFETAGVHKRYSVAPLEWFLDHRTWTERNDIYVEGCTALWMDAARKALDDANLEANEIDTIVTISTTGVATPSLEALVHKQMGFRPDVIRVPVFGLGCAGGVSGMETARMLAAARPGSNVLMVAVEACTLGFRTEDVSKADIVSAIIFGDGAAAVCLSTEPSNGNRQDVMLQQGSQHTWEDTLDIMGWKVDELGLGVVLSRSLPDFATKNVGSAVNEALEKAGLTSDDVARFVCHPGGAKVVEAIEKSTNMATGTLDIEREVLHDFGNMSAPTVLFVLERVLNSGQDGKMMMIAFGPGFTASFVPFQVGVGAQPVRQIQQGRAHPREVAMSDG